MAVILSGSLTHFPLSELLPMLGKHRTGTLMIDAEGDKAQFLLRAGLVVWAESASSTEPLDVALEALTWTHPMFSFVDEIVLPHAASELSLSIEELVERLRERAKPFGDDVRFRVVDDSALQDSMSLSPAELKLLIRIGMGRTFAQLVEGRDTADVSGALKRFLEAGLILMHEEPQAVRKETPVSLKTSVAPMPEVSRVASLTEEGESGGAYVLLAEEVTIGREPVNTIAIADGSISGCHAVIRRSDQGFVLEDLGSRNGSFVNGERLTGPQPLADNDIVRLGKVVLTFNLATQVAPVDPTAH